MNIRRSIKPARRDTFLILKLEVILSLNPLRLCLEIVSILIDTNFLRKNNYQHLNIISCSNQSIRGKEWTGRELQTSRYSGRKQKCLTLWQVCGAHWLKLLHIPDLRWFNLTIFDFKIVWNGCTFSGSHTSNFKCWTFPGLAICG